MATATEMFDRKLGRFPKTRREPAGIFGERQFKVDTNDPVDFGGANLQSRGSFMAINSPREGLLW